MASKLYNGNVSIWQNTKGRLVVEPDDDGAYNNENTTELYSKVDELADKLEVPRSRVTYNKDSGKKVTVDNLFFNPFFPRTLKDGLNLVILEGRGQSPYMALLEERDVDDTTKTTAKKKLA